MDKIVGYAATRNIYRNTAACIKSVLKNGNIDKVIVLSEDDCFPYMLGSRVLNLNVSEQTYFNQAGPNAIKRWTWMALMKAAFSKLFPSLDRILFLDSDTIVEHGISDLWDLDMTEYYFAAVPQTSDGRGGRFMTGAYFNTGAMMCDLKKLRQDGKDDCLINALNTVDYEFPEQDCINKLCEGKILPLPGRYNVCDFTVPDTQCYIRHFAAHGEWVNTTYFREYEP